MSQPSTTATRRFCREVQGELPALLAGDVSGWPERTMRAHLRHCTDCSAELARQEELARGLAGVRDNDVDPPAALLDGLLQSAARPGLRERAAVPARGAISGARPGLSVAFLTVGALASTGMGWAAWRGARWVVGRVRH